MKRIKNPWVGKKDYYCFGCCPHNPSGVKMKFFVDGDDIVCPWKPEKQFQGWIETLHGGIQSVLLDEICAWAVMWKMQTTGVTAKMETRYKHSISTNDSLLLLRAHVVEIHRNIAIVEATLSDSAGQVCTEATCTYFTFTKEKSKEMGFNGCLTEDDD